MSDKKFKFINEASKREFLGLPKDVINKFGSDLNAVQQNKRPFSDFKDISSSVGQGAIELIENGSPAYRTVYCAKYLNTVYILHSFTKTKEGTDVKAMQNAQQRYKMMMEEVRDAKKSEKHSNKKGKK